MQVNLQTLSGHSVIINDVKKNYYPNNIIVKKSKLSHKYSICFFKSINREYLNNAL